MPTGNTQANDQICHKQTLLVWHQYSFLLLLYLYALPLKSSIIEGVSFITIKIDAQFCI